MNDNITGTVALPAVYKVVTVESLTRRSLVWGIIAIVAVWFPFGLLTLIPTIRNGNLAHQATGRIPAGLWIGLGLVILWGTLNFLYVVLTALTTPIG